VTLTQSEGHQIKNVFANDSDEKYRRESRQKLKSTLFYK